MGDRSDASISFALLDSEFVEALSRIEGIVENPLLTSAEVDRIGNRFGDNL
jgi:hypothetical protein